MLRTSVCWIIRVLVNYGGYTNSVVRGDGGKRLFCKFINARVKFIIAIVDCNISSLAI